jgi:octanoyl-[GcvH]:protein N-octanoyltransferase
LTHESEVQLVRTGFPERPAFDVAVSHAILERVATGELPETIRVARPGAMVAFGKQDRSSSGYAQAAQAARDQRFAAVERLAGGRAAVFHEQTVALAWARRDPDPWPGTHDRFREIAGIIERALTSLGIDASIGEIPGEYCPGEYSLNARGEKKLVGLGQRIVKGASHIGGVIVVGHSARVREVLVPVYEALRLGWKPDTTGSVEDELGPIEWDDVADAVIREWRDGRELTEADLDAETLALAERLEPDHRSP